MEGEKLALLNLIESGIWGRELRSGFLELGSYVKLLKKRKGDWREGLLGEYERRGISVLANWEKDYPSWLKQTEGCPEMLFTQGDVGVLSKRCVCVVGTRKINLKTRAKVDLVVGKIDKDSVVVSGLARGVDSLAHQAALDAHLPTVAVLAHGLQMIYPPENYDLAELIVKSGGALLSELPWGVTPRPRFFLERNRVMVGMSEVVVVIEGGLKSGSMASANLAANMGREVYAVEGSELSDRLIEEGAIKISL